MDGLRAYTWRTATKQRDISQSLLTKSNENGDVIFYIRTVSGAKVTVNWWDGTSTTAQCDVDYDSSSWYQFLKNNDGGTERDIEIKFHSGYDSCRRMKFAATNIELDVSYVMSAMKTNLEYINFVYSYNCYGDLSYFKPNALKEIFLSGAGPISGTFAANCSQVVRLWIAQSASLYIDLAALNLTSTTTSIQIDGSRAYGDMNNLSICPTSNDKYSARYYKCTMYEYTSIGYFKGMYVRWTDCTVDKRSNASDISEQSLVNLISDKTATIIADNQTGGTLSIGGYNPAITDQATLYKIDYITTPTEQIVADTDSPYYGESGYGWTVVYNS